MAVEAPDSALRPRGHAIRAFGREQWSMVQIVAFEVNADLDDHLETMDDANGGEGSWPPRGHWAGTRRPPWHRRAAPADFGCRAQMTMSESASDLDGACFAWDERCARREGLPGVMPWRHGTQAAGRGVDMVVVFELGWDSFVVCAAVGLLVPGWRHRLGWSVAFGACDALATLVSGFGFGSMGLVSVVGITALAWMASASSLSRRLAALPVLLCIDNLAGTVRAVDALPAGVASGALAAAGFGACSLVGHLVARFDGRQGHLAPSALSAHSG